MYGEANPIKILVANTSPVCENYYVVTKPAEQINLITKCCVISFAAVELRIFRSKSAIRSWKIASL